MANDTQPPGGGDDRPKPPPGISDVTHAPVRSAIFEIVRDLRQHYLDAKQPATVEDLLVIVCPKTACEVYTWSWRVQHPDVRAYVHNPGLLPWAKYVQNDVIGTVLGYCVCSTPLQREGWVNLLPFNRVHQWKAEAEAFRAQNCRSR